MQRDSKFFLLSYFIVSIGTPGQFIFSIKEVDTSIGTIMVAFYFIAMALSFIIFSKLSDNYMKRKMFVIFDYLIISLIFITYYFISTPFDLYYV
ncbi:MAG: hypothetical protein ACFFD2_25315 [Promethearchaeota archaeon]